MGSGILLAVLVVLWIVVLVPMVLDRGRGTGTAENEGTVSTMRVLRRRGAEESGGLADNAIQRLRRPLRDPRVEADVVARRKRTLIGLIGLALVWMVLAIVVASYFWTAQIVLDLMVFGYIVYLRLEAQREAERRERRAVRFADRGARTAAGHPATGHPSAGYPGAHGSAPRGPATGPSGPGRGETRPATFSDADVTAPLPRAAGRPPSTGWTPNPVPVPTYVNKATAPPRHHHLDEQLIRIDDDDPSFVEVAEWEGKRAVGD